MLGKIMTIWDVIKAVPDPSVRFVVLAREPGKLLLVDLTKLLRDTATNELLPTEVVQFESSDAVQAAYHMEVN